MKPVKLALIIAAVSLIGIACTQSNSDTKTSSQPAAVALPAASPTATPDEFASARANYAKNCSVCHGDEAKGGIVKVENVKLKVPSLREGHALSHTNEQFVKQITKGGDGMPAFKEKLKPDDINGLVRFIRHEFQGGQTLPTKPNMKM